MARPFMARVITTITLTVMRTHMTMAIRMITVTCTTSIAAIRMVRRRTNSPAPAARIFT